MKFVLFFLFAFLFISTSLLQAQQTDDLCQTNYAGKDFWLTLFEQGRRNEFHISSKHNATVTFTYTADNSVQTFKVTAGNILTIPQSQITLALGTLPETVQNKSLHITSDSNIVVYFTSWGNSSDDGMMIYPSDRQKYGNKYFLNGLPFLASGVLMNRGGEHSIVATCDRVTLQITPSRNTARHPAGIPFIINLNKGETYILASSGRNTRKDLSGTKIEIIESSCCNPINIFNTGTCSYAYWPYSAPPVAACDHFLEQVLPVSSWDTLYPIVPYQNSPYSIFKIVSSASNNTIYLDGAFIATLGAGEYLDTILKQPTLLHATAPVSVSQHMVSFDISWPRDDIAIPNIPPDSISEPNSALLIPLRDGVQDAYFHTVGQYLSELDTLYNKLHKLILISRAENIPTITLNDVNITQEFLPFPSNPDYQYASINLDTGIGYHLLSEDRIIAYYYATAFCGSLDFHLGDVNPVKFYRKEEMSRDTISICINEPVLLQAVPGTYYEWSTGESSQNIRVNDTGFYEVYTFQNEDCIGVLKQFFVKLKESDIRPFDLGRDTTICEGDQVILSSPYAHTVWSTGGAGNEIKVQAPGWYQATAMDTCNGYSVSDSIYISDTVCLSRYCNFNFPNAFSPNGDDLNEFFLPVYYGTFNQYTLNIYNRYGERVFHTYKISEGWNGLYKGIPADLGVYYYYCRFYCLLKGYVELKGDITLLR